MADWLRGRDDLVLAVVGALAGAFVLDVLGVPGGAVVGGTVGSMCVVLARNRDITLSPRSLLGLQVIIGMLVGIRFTPQTVHQLGAQALPAVMAAVVTITAGLAIGRGLRRFAGLPPWVLLATSPGGLEVLIAIAVERREGPVEVAMFHFVRVLLVLLSIPLLVWLGGL